MKTAILSHAVPYIARRTGRHRLVQACIVLVAVLACCIVTSPFLLA